MDGEHITKSRLICFTSARCTSNSKRNYNKISEAPDTYIKTSSFKYDICGLERSYDVFSDDDTDGHICKSKHINNKITKSQIKQQFDLIDKENAKVQLKLKNLFKSITKKDKIIEELKIKNVYLTKQLEETTKNNSDQNTNLIDLANTGNRLQKEIEKKNLEILELQSKLNKNEILKNNLLKDIDFYKTELNTMKKESLKQSQKCTEQEYEKLQKKFYEIKIENGKLCRKFKEIRLADGECCPKNPSYHVLAKKFESVQHNIMKLKLENKQLKDKIRKNSQTCDDETSHQIKNATSLMNDEIKTLTQVKENLEKENQNYKLMLQELELETRKTKSLLTDLQVDLNEKITYCQQCEDELKNLKTTCIDLKNKIKALSTEKEAIMKQYSINEENNNTLKLKFDELLHEMSRSIISKKADTKLESDESSCENCLLLKQEIEKLGYANLRLNKEKQNLQSNFQKLSIKTSKLTLKMEELQLEKQKQLNQQQEGAIVFEKDENLLQQNVLLSKRLHNLLKKSEKLFKANVIHQQARNEKDEEDSNENIIEELNENLSYSKSNLENIEIKLNEEEWKLNAALKHIKSVKEQMQMEI